MPTRPLSPASVRAAVRTAIPEDWKQVAEMRELESATNRRNRGGRPKSANPRMGQVMVRLSANERAILDERAGPGKIAEYLRALGLGRRPRISRFVPDINRQAWTALAPVVANLNQLTKRVNESGNVDHALVPLLADLRQHVMALRASLLGRDCEDTEPNR